MPVTLVERYNPAWPDWFDQIRQTLQAGLGGSCLAIEHVGSTAVPGMIAKPIIDIDIVIDDGCFQQVKEKLARVDYTHMGDQGIKGREAFDLTEPQLATELPAHHLYVCVVDSDELGRHRAFCDFLRQNPRYVDRLSRLKWELARDHHNDRQAYIAGKAALVQQVIALALREK